MLGGVATCHCGPNYVREKWNDHYIPFIGSLVGYTGQEGDHRNHIVIDSVGMSQARRTDGRTRVRRAPRHQLNRFAVMNLLWSI